MSKPLGLVIGLSATGPTLRVTHPTRAEDLVWDAVEQAQMEGWTFEQTKRELKSAWVESLQREAKEIERGES